MEKQKQIFSFIGIGFGSIAFLLAIVHFSAGPFSPKPTVEEYVAEKAALIKQATLAKLKGVEAPENKQTVSTFDTDRIVSLVTSIMGGIAFILAVLAFATNEPTKAAGSAAILGVATIAFQTTVMVLSVIMVLILIGVILDSLGLSL